MEALEKLGEYYKSGFCFDKTKKSLTFYKLAAKTAVQLFTFSRILPLIRK